jgi:formamidopyrimidine-DNA glycosylase
MKVLELPEAANLAKQITETISGKKIARVTAGLSEHKFAFYHGDPADYDPLLRGKTIETALAHGGLIEIHAGDAILLFADFVSLKYHGKDEPLPKKHRMKIISRTISRGF